MKTTIMDITGASSGLGFLAAKVLLTITGTFAICFGIATLVVDRARQVWQIHRDAKF